MWRVRHTFYVDVVQICGSLRFPGPDEADPATSPEIGTAVGKTGKHLFLFSLQSDAKFVGPLAFQRKSNLDVIPSFRGHGGHNRAATSDSQFTVAAERERGPHRILPCVLRLAEFNLQLGSGFEHHVELDATGSTI